MKNKKTTGKKIVKAAKPVKKKVAAPKKKVPTSAKKKPVAKKKPAAKKIAKPAKKKTPVILKKKPVFKKKVQAVKAEKIIPEARKVAPKPVKKTPAKKGAKITSSQFVKPTQPDVSITKSGRIKVQFEYYTRSSVGVLYNSFSNASGLAAWFADNVYVTDNVFTFSWDGSQESAFFLEAKEDEYVRFRWSYQPDDCYFEFRIKIDSITNEVALVITDFVEKGEEKESQLLWDSQVHELMHILGS